MELNEARHHRDELIREACRAAARRLAGSTSPDPALIATGELLFWLIASDSSMLSREDKRAGYEAYLNRENWKRKLLMQGLRYPRNVLAHEAEAWEFTTTDQYSDIYTDKYDPWTWTDLSAPPAGSKPSMVKQHEAYQERLKGKPVGDTVHEALEVLEDFWTRP